MKKLTRAGFYSDLSYGDFTAPTLALAIKETPHPLEDFITNYLQYGCIFIVSPCITKDILGKQNEIIGSLSILTDGVWAWPSDLAYYVSKYHVRIPDIFLTSMANNNWSVPKNINIKSLEL